MAHVQLIHWSREEGEKRAGVLRAVGHEVLFDASGGPELLRRLREAPPEAVVIDLTRLPSQGREVGVYLRHLKSTRHIPLVFAGGEPAKASRIRELLPDAVFTEWARIGQAVKQAIARQPRAPIATASVFEAYRGVPLAKKLGIKQNFLVRLMNAPEGFETLLGELPGGARLLRGKKAESDLLIWFVRSSADLRRGLRTMPGEPPVWIAWPKKSAGIATDLDQRRVREQGLAAGLVDYKICRIDAAWAALLFRRRKPK